MKPIHKFNGGRGATLCHGCGFIITERLTTKLYCLKCLEDLVFEYPTKHKGGFLASEEQKLMSRFENINKERYYDVLKGTTCEITEDGLITYHCDIFTALRCGIENRDQTLSEWD